MIFAVLFTAGAVSGAAGFAVAAMAQPPASMWADRGLLVAKRLLGAGCVLIGLSIVALVAAAVLA